MLINWLIGWSDFVQKKHPSIFSESIYPRVLVFYDFYISLYMQGVVLYVQNPPCGSRAADTTRFARRYEYRK